MTHPNSETTLESENPLDFNREYQTRFKVAELPGLPRLCRASAAPLPRLCRASAALLPRFCGGLAGYFGYDTIRYAADT